MSRIQRADHWRLAGCKCPVDSEADQHCTFEWIRCNDRLAWLLPELNASGHSPDYDEGMIAQEKWNRARIEELEAALSRALAMPIVKVQVLADGRVGRLATNDEISAGLLREFKAKADKLTALRENAFRQVIHLAGLLRHGYVGMRQLAGDPGELATLLTSDEVEKLRGNHDGECDCSNTCTACSTFVCAHCHQLRPACVGADDDFPNHCDDCVTIVQAAMESPGG